MQQHPEYRKTILWQGLGLILVPMFLSVLVLLVLNQAWQKTLMAAREEDKQNELIKQLNQTLAVFEKNGMMSFASSMGNAKDAEKNKTSFVPLLEKEFRLLESKAADSPKTLATFMQLKANLLAEARVISQLPSSSSTEMEKALAFPKTISRLAQCHSEIKRVLQAEYKGLAGFRSEQNLAFSKLNSMINIAAVVTIALSTFLVFVFSRSFSSRLERLALRASKIEEAGDSVFKQNDELSYLETVLNQTSQLLIESAEHRRSILSMVAHDMRSPLMAVQANLELILELSSELSEKSKMVMLNALARMSEILQRLNELLEKEKSTQNIDLNVQSANSFDEAPTRNEKSNIASRSLTEFFVKPRIFQKSFALVMIPLLVQGFVMLSIGKQMSEIQEFTNMERIGNDYKRIFNLNRVNTILGASLSVLYALSGAEKAKAKADKCFAECDSLAYEVRVLFRDYPRWRSFIDEMGLGNKNQLLRIRNLKAHDSLERINETLLKFGTETPEYTKARQSAIQLSEEFEQELSRTQAKLKTANYNLEETFKISLITNCALAILLLLAFNNDISGRLRLLIENASALGRRKTMANTIKGHDEIAYLGLVLFRSQEKLRLASEQRSQITNSLVNEMKQPLQNTNVCLQEFKELESDSMPKSVLQQLERAEKNISRVAGFVEDLINMETLEAGKLNLEITSFKLPDMIDTAIASIASLAIKRNIEIFNHSTEIIVTADRNRLIQVLINLLGNALKFSPENTAIEIKTQDNSESIRILVRDQGPGMDENTRMQIFDKYFQAETAEKKQGFGLGLSICSLIIHAHSGKLGVDSELGQGSTFWFEVPKQVLVQVKAEEREFTSPD